jgi:Domain of unknown function (DUF222)
LEFVRRTLDRDVIVANGLSVRLLSSTADSSAVWFVVPLCDDDVMSSPTTSLTAEVNPAERLELLFEELAELTGQRNAIDGRVVEIVAELDRDGLWGATGARSVPALVAWKTGTSPANAHTIATVAHRLEEFPRCAQGMREGRLSLDQVGVIADRATDGSDEHYAELASVATVTQLRTAVKLEPRPRTRSPARTTAVDHQDRRRGPHVLADQTSTLGGGEVRRGPAVSSRRAGHRVEARPRRWRS